MDFNIIHLLLTAAVAIFAGCLIGLRVSRFRKTFSNSQTSTVLLSMAGYLATLYFLSRDNWYEATIAGLVVGFVGLIPFASISAVALLSTRKWMESLALICAALFATVGTGIYYCVYIIDDDEFAGLLVLFVVAIELVTALLLLLAVALNRKKNEPPQDPQLREPSIG